MGASAVLDQPVAWKPNSQPQMKFLASSAYEAMYGGAAGGGKSEALLLGALRHVDHPDYRALLLRRTFPELKRSIIDRSFRYYPIEGGKWNGGDKSWKFPSGAIISFGHLEHANSVHAHQSAEYQYIGFDELTSFLESQYKYMLSRARSAQGIPVRIRSATNPGGEGHEWVIRRWAPWLWRPGMAFMPQYEGPRVNSQTTLHVRATEDDQEEFHETEVEESMSRVFIGAKASDNPALAINDPKYVLRLKALDRVTRKQLLDGDWSAAPNAGELFQRGWYKVVDAAPADVIGRWRTWDRAATEPHATNPNPDWTVGVRMSKTANGIYYVEDVVRLRKRPKTIDATILNTARADPKGTSIGVFQDPGSAGVNEAETMLTLLAGFHVNAEKVTGDKLSRAKPMSAQVEAGNVCVVRAPWNEIFFQEHEAFPEGDHDDQVDAASAAFQRLSPTSASERFRLLSQM